MTRTVALLPAPDVVEGRRLLWRDTSITLIAIALAGAVLVTLAGGSSAATPTATLPLVVAQATAPVSTAVPPDVLP